MQKATKFKLKLAHILLFTLGVGTSLAIYESTLEEPVTTSTSYVIPLDVDPIEECEKMTVSSTPVLQIDYNMDASPNIVFATITCTTDSTTSTIVQRVEAPPVYYGESDLANDPRQATWQMQATAVSSFSTLYNYGITDFEVKQDPKTKKLAAILSVMNDNDISLSLKPTTVKQYANSVIELSRESLIEVANEKQTLKSEWDNLRGTL